MQTPDPVTTTLYDPATQRYSVGMDTEAIDRLERWADNLPHAEAIPVAMSEVLDLVEHFNGLFAPPETDRGATILGKMMAGDFIFRGHKVVVL